MADVMLVGHCGPDAIMLKTVAQRALPGSSVELVNDQEALDALTGSGFGRREDEAQDHSPFALALFDALTGSGDVNDDGVVVATELYLYLRDHVELRAEDEANHQQTPGIWPLRKHDKGEFIFLTGEPDLPPAPPLTTENNPYRGLQSFDAKVENP